MKTVIVGLVVLAVVVAIGAATAGVVWLGWSHLAVPIFGAPALTFAQVWLGMIALGLFGRVLGLGARGGK